MTDLMYAMSVEGFAPMLQSLSDLLDKAAGSKADGQGGSGALAEARLAPDMFTLAAQVQFACHHARDGAGRLMGQPPRQPGAVEQTLDQLKAGIAETIGYLKTAPEAAFEGAANRQITIPVSDEMALEMDGLQFLRDWALPHFYFHVVTAYDILRHKGVEIGKRDYLSYIGCYLRQHVSA